VSERFRYPLFVSLEKRVCLVVGGGAVAERKTRLILQYGATVRLVAEDLSPWLQAQCEEGTVLLVGRTYTKDCLGEVDLVFAATSDWALNRLIAEDAAQRHLLCNMATEPEQGSFIVPAMLERGPLTIAISTGGASPALAVRIKQQLEREFGAEWIVLLRLMALLRAAIQARGLDSVENQNIYRRIVDLPLLEGIHGGEKAALLEAITEICHPWIGLLEVTKIWNEAWKPSS
jgi:precorrin-2 dehydrogenase / sirohydrochlorin ferrochelatase